MKELCVHGTLDYYIKAIEKLRDSTKLLVSFIKPHRAVSSSTVGRWIIDCQAGIDTEMFSAHSTSCKAVMSVSTDAILVSAG